MAVETWVIIRDAAVITSWAYFLDQPYEQNEAATGILFPWRQFFVRAIDRSLVHLRVVIGIGSTGFRDLWISDLRISGVWIWVFQGFWIFGFF